MFIVVIIVTAFIGEIFFVDLIFSTIPLVSVAYCYSSGIFLPQADMLITLALISTVIFFTATLFGTKHVKEIPAPQEEYITEDTDEIGSEIGIEIEIKTETESETETEAQTDTETVDQPAEDTPV